MNVKAALNPRAQLIMYILRQIKGDGSAGRFTGYEYGSHHIEGKWIENGIEYWLPEQDGCPWANGNDARVVFTDIKFNNADNLKLSEPITLSSEQQDAYSIVRDNRGRDRPLSVRYNASFSETTSESERFLAGLDICVRTWFGSGEQQPVSAGVELTATARAEFEKTRGTEISVTRELEDTIEVGDEKIKAFGTRQMSKMRRTATGTGSLEHKIFIGSFSYWAGAIPRWDWSYEWESFADFLSVIKGEGYGDLSDEVRNKPAPSNEIEYLQNPLGEPVEVVYDYDSVTDAKMVVQTWDEASGTWM